MTHKRLPIAISVGSILDKIDPNIVVLHYMISIHLFVWAEGDAVCCWKNCRIQQKISYFCLMKFCYFLHCCWHISILLIYYNQLMILIRGNVLCINSYDAGDRIFWLSYLLTPWLIKSWEHQQAWYWLCRTDNINFKYVGQAKSKIQFRMWLHLL